MSKTITYDPAEDEPIDYKAAVVECIEKVDKILREIHDKQEETARLREETKVILERLKAA